MTEIHGYSENDGQIFPQDDSNIFFPGAERGFVLSRIKEEVSAGTNLVVLAGEEGSGKTVICRMLERQGIGGFLTLMFPQTVESFEDVVHEITVRLGIEPHGNVAGKGVGDVVDNIVEVLKKEEKGLLIIFDEAENLYLATLERVRKMLDQATKSGAGMHILFSGRPSFVENCEQLTICDFQNTEELYFKLKPMTKEETGAYLHGYATHCTEFENPQIFDDETTDNIYDVARGNLRMTNILAEEALKAYKEETSFMGLLNSVKEDVEAAYPTVKKTPFRLGLPGFSPYVVWALGAGTCLLVLFFLLVPWGGDEQDTVIPVPPPEKSAPLSQLPEISTKTPVVAPVAEKPVVEDKVIFPAQILPKESETEGEVKWEVVQLPAREEQHSTGQIVVGETVIKETERGGATGHTKVVLVPLNVKKKSSFAGNVAAGSTPRRIRAMRVKKSFSITKGSVRMQQRVQTQKGGDGKQRFSVERIFKKRLWAATAWSKGKRDHMYTIQLMVLTSKNAEKNLKRMLSQDNYRRQADNFYIFKKKSQPWVLFVFYGEYSTITKARMAKNSLASFLQEHKPYAISIKGAVAKTKK